MTGRASNENTADPHRAFDVVTVPDFAGARPDIFEARTLFFLAAWLEHAGTAQAFPLHVACVGEPPETVRRMAEQCGAAISIHAPIGLEPSRTANKLRGLEVTPRTSRALLLDVDVFVLGDISPLGDLGDCIAASAVGKPRLGMRYWRKIYPGLGMELPDERISSMLGELLDPGALHLRTPRQNERLTAMLPFYNSGVLLVPWDAGLRPVWEDHLRRIAAMFSPDDSHWKWLACNDEVGLATAVQLLRQRGIPFARLPDEYHVRWQQTWGGDIRWEGVKLFHALRVFRMSDRVTLTARALEEDVRAYCAAIRERRIFGGHRFKDVIRQNYGAFREFTIRFEEELLRLLDVHVAPLIESVAVRARSV